MSKLYYQAPSDASFIDMKRAAIETWQEVADHPGYLAEKVEKIESLENVGDNFMYIFAMFDGNNQKICGAKLHQHTKDELNERLIDGGSEYAIIH